MCLIIHSHVAGPTQSGKTSLLVRILESNQILIKPKPTKIYYCYEVWQPNYDKLKLIYPSIYFHQGLIETEEINKDENNLMILDDLMTKCENDERILNLFTTDSHHNNISVFLITQNIFSKGKFSRTISLNSNYIILLNNPRDKQQINCLARQMYPKNSKFLIEAYNDATSTKFGHLFLDLTQSVDNNMRVQSGITLDEQRIIYQEK